MSSLRDLRRRVGTVRSIRQITGAMKMVAAARMRRAKEAIVAGRARVGIMIPEDYSRRLQAGQTAQVLIKVDGSVSSVAAETVNVGNALALRESLRAVLGDRPLPVESRPQVLFNPDTRSANFFIPGLLVVLCQMMATALTANAIVREKARSLLEEREARVVAAPPEFCATMVLTKETAPPLRLTPRPLPVPVKVLLTMVLLRMVRREFGFWTKSPPPKRALFDSMRQLRTVVLAVKAVEKAPPLVAA